MHIISFSYVWIWNVCQLTTEWGLNRPCFACPMQPHLPMYFCPCAWICCLWVGPSTSCSFSSSAPRSSVVTRPTLAGQPHCSPDSWSQIGYSHPNLSISSRKSSLCPVYSALSFCYRTSPTIASKDLKLAVAPGLSTHFYGWSPSCWFVCSSARLLNLSREFLSYRVCLCSGRSWLKAPSSCGLNWVGSRRNLSTALQAGLSMASSRRLLQTYCSTGCCQSSIR